MWKKLLLATFTLLLLLQFSFNFQTITAYAEDDLSSFKCSKGGFFGEEFTEKVDEYKEEDANMAEKFLTGQMQNLWNIGDINGLSTLIFGNPYCVWADDILTDETKIEMAPDGIFTIEEREKIINPILKMFSAIFVSLLCLAMMISGLKVSVSSIKGRAMADFGEDLKMWVFAVLFIGSYSLITNTLFQLNAAVVLSFKDLLETGGVKVDSFSIMASWTEILEHGTGIGSLLLAILAEWILALVLNIVYIARKVIVLVLLALGFVAGYSLLFAKTRPFFGTWLRELLGNVFLQSIHALIMYGMAMSASLGANVIYKLGLMMMFIPLTGMISKWLKIGDSSSKLGSSLTMVGLGGAMSTMMLTSQAGNIMRGGSSSGGNMYGGSMSGGVNSNSFASDSNQNGTSFSSSLMTQGGGSDSSLTSISTDASGANSSTWMNSKSAISKMGGAVLGAAGMVAGPPGVMAGKMAGEQITGALMQAPRNAGMGIKNAVSTIQAARNYTGLQGNGFSSMMRDLPARREFFANMGESVGSMAGAGALGRSLGSGLSGVSRQRLAATPVAEGGRGVVNSAGNIVPATFSGMAKQYPGAQMQLVQTNRGSSMWMNTGSGFQQVGLTGAADPTLKNGETRAINYQLASSGQQFQVQPNGSYKDVGSMSANQQGGDSFAGMSANTSTNGSTPNIPATSGLKGSTPELMRTSEAYIVGGASKNGEINPSTLASINSPNAVKYDNPQFKGDRINPDSFVYHNPIGVNNSTTSDNIANSVNRTSSKVDKSFKSLARKSKNEVRSKKIV